MIMITIMKMMMTNFIEWSRAVRSASSGAISSLPLVPIAYPLIRLRLFSLLHFLLVSFSSSALISFSPFPYLFSFSSFPNLTFSSLLLIYFPPSLPSSSSSSLRTDYQYNPRGSMASVKKKILITHNLRMLKIKTKEYGKGQTLHNFMLEEVVLQHGISASYHICCAILCREINRCCYLYCLFSYFSSNNNQYPPLIMLLLLLFSIVYHIWHSYFYRSHDNFTWSYPV